MVKIQLVKIRVFKTSLAKLVNDTYYILLLFNRLVLDNSAAGPGNRHPKFDGHLSIISFINTFIFKF